MQLLTHLQSLIPVSTVLADELGRIVKTVTIGKNGRLVAEGERCRYIYFIASGMVRGFYYNDGKEITHWFAREQEFATSFYSFITQAPAAEYIEAVEPCELYAISYTDLQHLYAAFPETERVGRLLTEAYYIKLEGRLLSLQFTEAKTRYENLVNNNPALLQRAPLGQIASYLGITQETLSRIRAKAAS